MFTGIIEETGVVQSLRRTASSAVITIAAKIVLDGVKVGDSIAVNGICLTVTAFTTTAFTADVMHETINRTSLSLLHHGSQVNLERALKADGRFGGHIVSGHIDGTGVIASVRRDDNAVWFTIRTDQDILRYIIKKGSVAIDGISLTVATISDNDFSVSVIPHTFAATTLASRKYGDTVNIENDCIGKYIEKFIQIPGGSPNIWKNTIL